MTAQKIGRNEPCPCMQGKKYKHCHGGPEGEAISEIDRLVAISPKLTASWIAKYGYVRPVVTTALGRKRFVLVGKQLHGSTRWQSFHDFLRTFCVLQFPYEFWNREYDKPVRDRHPLVEFHVRHDECLDRVEPHSGPVDVQLDGLGFSFLSLAWDMYVVAQHCPIPTKLIADFQDRHAFHGARHELMTAATLVRAGYFLKFEDETDSSTPHAEFTAIHRLTGTNIAVEAKALHRNGVLGHVGDGTVPTLDDIHSRNIPARIAAWGKKSLKKAKAHSLPFVLFVDANIPQSVEDAIAPTLIDDLDKLKFKYDPPHDKSGQFKGFAINLLIVTNTAHHYGVAGEPPSIPNFHIQKNSSLPHRHQITERELLDICEATMTYGAIPSSFDQG